MLQATPSRAAAPTLPLARAPAQTSTDTPQAQRLQRLLARPMRNLCLSWNEDLAMLTLRMNVRPVQCYSLAALAELKLALDEISACPGVVRHFVVASGTPKVFNFGGDLALFVLLARSRDVDSLKMYGRRCIDLLWWLETAADRGILTTAVVQGDCLGGGLETLLPVHRVIAERSAQAGFPEVLFNLFPGMGAWHFTPRKAGLAAANEMILSGQIYSADDLRQRGLVDEVVEDGAGEAAVLAGIRQIDPRWRGTVKALQARRMASPVSYEALTDVVDHWAESALNLTDRDLRLMERLVRAQVRKIGGHDEGAIEEIKRIELEQAWATARSVSAAATPGSPAFTGTRPATPSAWLA
ncbi:MAG: enoyl-CoA hydratase-related protein [Rubrivivax sp.]|nr:enoyl-CoA hydratase-related protein [Rubrivivax sp.]